MSGQIEADQQISKERGKGMHFSDRIKELRKLSSLSLRMVAGSIGISSTYLHDLERGHRALKEESDIVLKIANFYNYDYWLLRNEIKKDRADWLRSELRLLEMEMIDDE